MNGDFAVEFQLRRPTPEEEVGQLLERMDGDEIFAVSFWAMPAGKSLDQFDLRTWPKEYIQCAGTAERLTVEIRRLEAGIPRQFVVGRLARSGSATEKVKWDSGKHSTTVWPSEILTWREATALFVGYYQNSPLPTDYQLREISLG
jgi:hypothetical protein